MEVMGLKDTTVETGRKKYTIRSEKTADLPQWLALFLEEEDIVTIIIHDNKYYQRMIREERKKKQLNALEENFYEIAEITLKRVDTQNKKKLVMSLKELVDLRLEKMVKFAIQDVELSLPHREKILYNRLREEIKKWYKDIEEICNGD